MKVEIIAKIPEEQKRIEAIARKEADEFIGSLFGIDEGQTTFSRRTAYICGVEWGIEKALKVLDDMFMEQANISVNDWFRDSKNLFQGREEFIKRMGE